MGWFDNEKQKPTADAPARTGRRPKGEREEAEPRPSTAPGSALGERVDVNGTIVSREDLTVVGRVEGTIRAEQALRIAEGARVDAVIRGRRVLVQGTVTGDIEGTETVVLGSTASVTGNIQTPLLEIHDGGFFRGKVDMKSARKAAAEARAAREAATKASEGAKQAGRSAQAEAASEADGPGPESSDEAEPESTRTASDQREASAASARSTEAVKSS